jgi:hypothetical protein
VAEIVLQRSLFSSHLVSTLPSIPSGLPGNPVTRHNTKNAIRPLVLSALRASACDLIKLPTVFANLMVIDA